jgi:hypothetical protein
MTSRIVNPPNSVSVSLREAGFVPLPRLWVKSEDMTKIHKIAHAYKDIVNQIRQDHAKDNPLDDASDDLADKPAEPAISSSRAQKSDPKHSKDAAWAAYKKMRTAG